MRRFTTAACLAALGWCACACGPKGTAALQPQAPDPVGLFNEQYHVVLQGRGVRVISVHLAPGQIAGTHGHPPTFWYALTEGSVEWAEPGKDGERVELKAGSAAALPEAQSHTLHNVGTKSVDLLLFEMSASPPSATAKSPGLDACLASPQLYEVLVEGSSARLIRLHLPPGRRDALHAHPPSIVYALTSGELRAHGPQGLFKDVEIRAGFSVFQDEVRGHTLENRGENEVQLLQLELLN